MGTSVRVLVDYRPVQSDEVGVARGEFVLVTASGADRGFRVRKDDGAEGWIPAYTLNLLAAANPRKPAWTFRKFRKPSFSKREKECSLGDAIVVHAGDTAVLKCARSEGVVSAVKWYGPSLATGAMLTPGGKYSFESEDHQGLAVLYIAGCGLEDSGSYQCVQVNKDGSTLKTLLQLKVTGQ